MSAFIQAAQPSGDFLKFKTEGTEHTILVERVEERQATDFYSKQPLTYPRSGDPIMEQWIIGKSFSEEDGEFDAVMVIDSKRKRAAVGRALLENELNDLQSGGVLTLKFTGYGQASGTGQPPKDYEADYTPAEPAGGDWSDEDDAEADS